jgi:hypothetical protein
MTASQSARPGRVLRRYPAVAPTSAPETIAQPLPLQLMASLLLIMAPQLCARQMPSARATSFPEKPSGSSRMSTQQRMQIRQCSSRIVSFRCTSSVRLPLLAGKRALTKRGHVLEYIILLVPQRVNAANGRRLSDESRVISRSGLGLDLM